MSSILTDRRNEQQKRKKITKSAYKSPQWTVAVAALKDIGRMKMYFYCVFFVFVIELYE